MAQSKLYPVVWQVAPVAAYGRFPAYFTPSSFMPERRSHHAANHHLPPERLECESPVVICNEQHRFIVAESCVN